ncbi:MAG: YkgJ family cysteine cluster protein, partial [Candidatus Neomarinimicrobiota bacterium]
MKCRKGCGACCIAISISSPLPGMPNGKLAGVRCIHLTEENYCKIHNQPDFPAVCRNLKPSVEMCGSTFNEAMT